MFWEKKINLFQKHLLPCKHEQFFIIKLKTVTFLQLFTNEINLMSVYHCTVTIGFKIILMYTFEEEVINSTSQEVLFKVFGTLYIWLQRSTGLTKTYLVDWFSNNLDIYFQGSSSNKACSKCFKPFTYNFEQAKSFLKHIQ